MDAQDTIALDLACWVSRHYSPEKDAWLLAIEVSPPRAEESRERPPLDLVLVVDRSSSMVGPRIAAAVEAVRQICIRLNEGDRVGVVAFDSKVETVRSPGPAREGIATEVAVGLAELGVGYGTNISAGWNRALELISRGGVPGASKSILLLTDGLPSRGTRKTEELAELVNAGAKAGIVTSTVGIGDRFDEDLLAQMALAGGGSYRFAIHDEDTPVIADEEVEGLKGLVAESAVLHLGFSQAVGRFEVLHELKCRPDGDGIAIDLGRLYSLRPRRILVELSVEEGTRHFGALALACLGGASDRVEIGPVRILMPAPGQEASDTERVGAVHIPLRVARFQQEIWEHGRDASLSKLKEVLDLIDEELEGYPEDYIRAPEAQEAIARLRQGCERILVILQSEEDDSERQYKTAVTLKTMTEESAQTLVGLTSGGDTSSKAQRRRRGWGKR